MMYCLNIYNVQSFIEAIFHGKCSPSNISELIMLIHFLTRPPKNDQMDQVNQSHEFQYTLIALRMLCYILLTKTGYCLKVALCIVIIFDF